jgi:hypothetical protein
MAKQTGYIKATGTVDGDINFYYDELRGLPGKNAECHYYMQLFPKVKQLF